MNLDKLTIVGVLKDKLLVGPQSLYIDINTNCNINCNFCWIHSPFNKNATYSKPLRLKFLDIKQVIDQANEWHSKEIIISGDGEPSIHPEFEKIIKYIAGKNFKILITTNATFKDNLIPVISKIDYLYINFSAPEEKLYKKIQSPNNGDIFYRVLKNIKILSLINKKYQKPFLNIAFIINISNYQSIPKMLRLGEKIGIQKITFRMMEPTKFTKKLILSGVQKKELLKIIDKNLRTNFNFRHNLEEIRKGLVSYKESEFSLSQCFTGWFNLFVDFNKNVGICCHNENLIIGNLNHSPIEEIWQSKKAHKMRLMCKYKFNIKKYPFKGECEWCHWYKENNKIFEEIKKIKNA